MNKTMRCLLLLSVLGAGACSPSDEAAPEDPPSAAPDVSGSTTPAPLPPMVGGDTTAAMTDTMSSTGTPMPSPGAADSMSAAAPR
jgi:hypothetical protein